MKEVMVTLPDQSYRVIIHKGLMKHISTYIQELYRGHKIAIITDRNINELLGKKLRRDLQKEGFIVYNIVLEAGEKSKSMNVLENIYDGLLHHEMQRGDLLIALGGGVVGDVAGYAAATYLRGVPYIQIPTSLLAQIDSSVGGKVAINLSRGKNLVGSFYQPLGVFIDPDVLTTLEKRYFYDGLAEVIKSGCIADKDLFYELMAFSHGEEILAHIEDIIYRCCTIKKELVEKDERDQGERRLLNFGHTLGHAIEKFYHYQGFTHGEAVAIGMYAITQKSEELGFTKKGTSREIKNILKKYHLPYEVSSMHMDEIKGLIRLDKKNKGEYINLVLLKDIGQGFVQKIPRELI